HKYYPILDEVAATLKKNPKIQKVRIEGYADATGPDAFNDRISQERAAEVVSYLISRGIAADRLDAVGYGPGKPSSDNDTENGRAKNRRVIFYITQWADGERP